MAIDMNKGMRPNLYELIEAGIYELPPATQTELGGVIIGDGVNVDENGVISVPTSTAAYTKAETDALLAERDLEIERNASSISDETTARQAADYDLKEGIDANTAAITAEETAREAADANLQTQIDNLPSVDAYTKAETNALLAERDSEIEANTSAISAEETAREAADTELQTAIDDITPIIIDVNEHYSYFQLEEWAKTGRTYIKDGANIYPVIDYFYYEGEGDNRFYTLDTDSGKCYEYFFTDGTFNERYARGLITIDATPTTNSTNAVSSGGTKSYVDGLTGDLTTLTTEDKADLVSAINEVNANASSIFKVVNWSSSFNVPIPFCTEDIANTSIPKIEFSITDEEGAIYQVVGMIAYEVFDAASGGNRINCWPVCQFTSNGQKTLSVRFMCAGTSRKVAQRINAWVLLKKRD